MCTVIELFHLKSWISYVRGVLIKPVRNLLRHVSERTRTWLLQADACSRPMQMARACSTLVSEAAIFWPCPVARMGGRRGGGGLERGGCLPWQGSGRQARRRRAARGRTRQFRLDHHQPVIEHVHDPHAVLARAFELLKPGGTLYLDTTNINAHGHRRFGPHWRGLEPPRHLVLFNWESLQMLLRQVGFHAVIPKPRSVYTFIASASKAIRTGTGPDERVPSLMDRIAGQIHSMRLLVSHRDSEFITSLAHKDALHQ